MLIGLPVSECASVVDVHLVPCPWLAFPLPLNLQVNWLRDHTPHQESCGTIANNT